MARSTAWPREIRIAPSPIEAFDREIDERLGRSLPRLARIEFGRYECDSGNVSGHPAEKRANSR
jgi:hypothetical protein